MRTRRTSTYWLLVLGLGVAASRIMVALLIPARYTGIAFLVALAVFVGFVTQPLKLRSSGSQRQIDPNNWRSNFMNTEMRQAFAIRTLGIGLVVGLSGNILFYQKLIGLSFLIFTLIVAGAILLMFRWAGGRLGGRSLWPLLPILLFAGMVAVRADPLVTALDVLSVLALGGLVMYVLPGERPLDLTPFMEQVWGVIEAGLSIIPAGIAQLIDSWGWLRAGRLSRLKNMGAVVRGLAIAVPVVVVFGLLLGSADAVFADYLERFWSLFNLNGIDGLMEQGFLTGGLAFIAMGAMAYTGLRLLSPVFATPGSTNADSPDDEAETDAEQPDEEVEAVKAALAEQAAEKRKPAFKLGMIEATIVLGSVDLLFAAFVVIQFAYFFGGQANITVSGLTYSTYARRGFFELIAVSVLTLGLALWLDHVTVRQERRENGLFRALAVIVAALTSVMLVSAAQRMWLYEQAFGFTQLRVYTHVFMLWLGLLFVFYLLAVFRVRPNVFSLGILLCLIGYMVTMNVMDVDLYIAERNIARYHDGEELDIRFLNILSSDAVPAVIDLYQQSEPGSEAREWAGNWLAGELIALDTAQTGDGATIFSAHLGRSAARGLLEPLREGLPAYDPYRYPRYSYDYGF
ncbi:MAG: DUF4173 domain-containing protein [Anaerolineaceae bacterium]|nr:DUF4173 domain-containing protein [Anaerolineaceae bacterium]